MFYSHFIIIYKVNETSLVIFKYNQISEKCKKNLILKKIFQNNQVSKEFINIVLLSFMSTGSFNLKKKLPDTSLRIKHEKCNGMLCHSLATLEGE